MPETIEYTVPGMSCGHCEDAVAAELQAVTGVETVKVDLETKLVTVTGEELSDGTLRAAIENAGYEAS